MGASSHLDQIQAKVWSLPRAGVLYSLLCLLDVWSKMISSQAEAALRAEVEAAFSRLAVVRPATWRDTDARGGAKLAPSTVSQVKCRREPSSSGASFIKQTTSVDVGASSNGGITYWDELSKLCGDRIAEDVRERITQFVNNLSLHEIELLAGAPKP